MSKRCVFLVAGLGDLTPDELPGGGDVTLPRLEEAREGVRRHRGELPVGYGRDAVAVLDTVNHGPSVSPLINIGSRTVESNSAST